MLVEHLRGVYKRGSFCPRQSQAKHPVKGNGSLPVFLACRLPRLKRDPLWNETSRPVYLLLDGS